MLMNRIEFALMNNPLRAALQRYVEAPTLRRLGGKLHGGRALEIGCGRGVGAQLIVEVFGAATVDLFDLDHRMVRRARRRVARRRLPARAWVGDAAAIPHADAAYDAVFDFGMLHHVPDWRAALREIARVLKPGGRFYGEEVLRRFVRHPVTRALLEHPLEDRFDAADLRLGLEEAGFVPVIAERFWGTAAWFVAQRQLAPPP